MVKRKIIKRGSVSHVEQEKERLGNRFDPANEATLEILPDKMGINEIPIDTGIRAPRSVIELPPVDTPPVDTPSVDTPPVEPISSEDAKKPFINPGDEESEDTYHFKIKEESDTSSKDKKSFRDKVREKYRAFDNKLKSSADKIIGTGDKFVDKTERFLGADSGRNDDEMATRGGFATPKRELNYRKEVNLRERDILEETSVKKDQEIKEIINQLDEYSENRKRLRDLEFKKYHNVQLNENETKEYESLKYLGDPSQVKNYNELARRQKLLEYEKYDTDMKIRRNRESFDKISLDIERYNIAAIRGRDAYKKEHSVRKEWLAPFAQNVESMIAKPNIGDISQQVGYGDLTGKSFSTGMNAVVGKVKVADTANDWVKTKVGDRGLVEALVKVNQSNMITPFGAPGTIQHSRLGEQFSYNLPVRQIGVGEVTARPGYRLTPEDIHRKKKALSKPSVERKQPTKIKSKPSTVNKISDNKVSKVSVKGSLSMNMKLPIIATIGDTKSNSVKLTMDNIKPFTAKNIEINLNKISLPIMKRKMLKVKK